MLAFGFVSPWLLWGLALAGVPILIQWLHRRNYTQRVWGAMRFLRAATKAQSRRLRFESLLLLVLRVLILLLVAIALAEPVLESAGWLPSTASSVHRLLVIDTSLSMQYESDGRSVADRAREAARRIVATARTGDSLQLVTIGRRGRAVIREPAHDAVEVLNEIEHLESTEEFGDVEASLNVARELLNNASSSGRAELTVISDFQRTNWWPEVAAARTRLQKLLVDLAGDANLSMIRVGDETATNVAINGAEIDPLPVVRGAMVGVDYEIARWGAAAAETRPAENGTRIELAENDRVLQTNISDTAGRAAKGAFSLRLQEPGWHGLQLRVRPDGLEADDHRWLAVDVRDEVAVLLVNGRESSESLGRATDFVELALNPVAADESPAARSTGMTYRPVVVSEAEFARAELAEFDCVVLCDVPFLSEGEQSRLSRFVRGGGGLVIGLGPQVQTDAYSQWFDAGDNGLLPVSLLDVAGSEDPDAEPFHFAEPVPQGSPIVEPFVGNPQAGLTTANIYRYLRTQIRDQEPKDREPAASKLTRPDRQASEVRAALAYDNGDAAILERDVGAGRVLLVTTSLDDAWGGWALWPSFLPMMHRIVDYATSGDASASLLVGDVLRREYPVQSMGFSAVLQRPDGRRLPARTHMDEGATEITFEAMPSSGLYRVLLGPPLNRSEVVAVNVDPRESDLTMLDERSLRESLLSGVDARLTTGTASTLLTDVEPTPASQLTRWLLMAAFVLLLVEQVMAWKAPYGLACLGLSPLVLLGFGILPGVTVILLAVTLAAVLVMKRLKRPA